MAMREREVGWPWRAAHTCEAHAAVEHVRHSESATAAIIAQPEEEDLGSYNMPKVAKPERDDC